MREVFFLFTILLLIGNSNGQTEIPPYGVGPTTNNIFQYQTSTINALQKPICSDTSLQIVCAYTQETRDYQPFECWTYQSEQLFRVDVSVGKVIYDSPQHCLICGMTINETYYLTGVDLSTAGYPTVFLMNANETLDTILYVNSAKSIFYTENFDKNILYARSTLTGEIVANTTLPYYLGYSYLFLLEDSSILCFTATLLDSVTLEFLCSFSVSQVESKYFYSNTENIFIYDYATFGAIQVISFNSKCEGNWRIPFQYGDNTFSYDLGLNRIYFGSGSYLMSMNPDNGTDVVMITTGNIDDMFVGVDSASWIYFWNPYNATLAQYSPDLKNRSNLVVKLDYDGDISYANFVAFTLQGFFCSIQSGKTYTNIAVESSSNIWTWVTTISFIILGIGIVIAIGMTLKHKIMGEDPKGWNKRKIVELVAAVITSLGIIIITSLVCFSQLGSIQIVNDNTQLFENSLSEYYESNLLLPCSSPSMNISSIDLCTCSDSSSEYQNDGCLQGLCTNSIEISCSQYLANSCDCLDSVYSYNCDCIYNTDNTCSSNYTTTSTVNEQANSQWEICQKSFRTPTLILNINFLFLILFSVILVIGNILNIIVKFDVPVLDFILTILSLFFATIQFIIVLVGGILVASASNTCLNEVLSFLPGCVFADSLSTLNSSLNLASAALKNAYTNLATTPLMFFIASIPDLISLFICCRSDKAEFYESLSKIFCFCKRRSYTSVN